MLLEVRNATVHYHKVAALRGVSMDVPHGSVTVLIFFTLFPRQEGPLLEASHSRSRAGQ